MPQKVEGGGGLPTSTAPASSARPALPHPPNQRPAKGTGEFTKLAASEPDDQRRRQAAEDPPAMLDTEAIKFSLAQFRKEFDRRRLGVPTTPKLADESRIRLELGHAYSLHFRCAAGAPVASRSNGFRGEKGL